jgi:hypothetical protein
MKIPIRPRSEAEVVREFPLMGLVPGWYFRVTEISAGVYEAEGTDLHNRRVRRVGTDPDALVTECVRDAAAIAGREPG